jgi:hypothetical protein
LIEYWCQDDKGKNILYKSSGAERYPEFKLYKMIARTVHNSIPHEELKNPLFKSLIVDNIPKETSDKNYTVIDLDDIIT